jgi:Fic family protein
MSDLESFLHREDSLPLLIRAGLAHAQFESIHPFLDGNGRVGRLLITFMLTEKRVLREPVLYLSLFFKKHRRLYYDRLNGTRR